MKQLTALSFLIIITSCSSLSPYKVPIYQGNIFEDEDIEKLEQGLSKDQIQFIFGTALIKNPFRDSRWEYFNSVKIGEEIVAENKLSIFFSEDGLVERWILEEFSSRTKLYLTFFV
jgi:outer membrane protein assembly factor BamE